MLYLAGVGEAKAEGDVAIEFLEDPSEPGISFEDFREGIATALFTAIRMRTAGHDEVAELLYDMAGPYPCVMHESLPTFLGVCAPDMIGPYLSESILHLAQAGGNRTLSAQTVVREVNLLDSLRPGDTFRLVTDKGYWAKVVDGRLVPDARVPEEFYDKFSTFPAERELVTKLGPKISHLVLQQPLEKPEGELLRVAKTSLHNVAGTLHDNGDFELVCDLTAETEPITSASSKRPKPKSRS